MLCYCRLEDLDKVSTACIPNHRDVSVLGSLYAMVIVENIQNYRKCLYQVANVMNVRSSCKAARTFFNNY